MENNIESMARGHFYLRVKWLLRFQTHIRSDYLIRHNNQNVIFQTLYSLTFLSLVMPNFLFPLFPSFEAGIASAISMLNRLRRTIELFDLLGIHHNLYLISFRCNFIWLKLA